MISDSILNFKAPNGCGIVYGYYYLGILVYIGSTKYTIGKRAGINGKKYVYSNISSKFGEFILLHGWENLEVKILATPKLSELTKVENELIDQYDLINKGCNLYHACADDEDADEFTEKVNGYKANVYHDDVLRGDTRIGLIHEQTMKLNLKDKDIFKGVYIAPCYGNSMEKNTLGYYDENNTHTTVKKTLKYQWLGQLGDDYTISQVFTKAEDIYDFRREVMLVNKKGRSYKKWPLPQFMAERNL